MISRIACIKFIDAIVGRVLTRILPKAVPVVKRRISRILIIRPGGIGDAVLLLPILAAIKRQLPETEIHILAERRNRPVFGLSSYVSSTSCYDIPSELYRAVRGGYDAVIDTEQWHRLSAVIARMTKAPILVGFGTNERKHLFNVSVPYSHDDHETLSFRRLASAVLPALPVVAAQESFSFTERTTQKAQLLLASLTGVRGYVALFPGASIPEKRWPVQSWRALAESLFNSHGVGIVIVGGKDVEKYAAPIIQGVAGINTAGQLTLLETTALLKHMQLLISGDSGVLHLAWLMGTPTVSLFGPSNAAKWAPTGVNHFVVGRTFSCSPCSAFGMTPQCPHGVRCMNEITADQVVEAAVRLLRKM
jgi:ADP-heptose:LPS heptosyltransferase